MSKQLFNVQNVKTIKGEPLGWRTLILYLAPHTEAQDSAHKPFSVCPHASPGCAKLCLFTAGRGAFSSVRHARVDKTLEFMFDRAEFITKVEKEIEREAAKKSDLKLCIRLNGTSDINWEPIGLMGKFSSVQFYDYSKRPNSLDVQTSNYHITFSRSELNHKDCVTALSKGVNVAVVFDTKRGQPLPLTCAFDGKSYPVLDGDRHDLRFLDPKEHVVGLRAKGKARSPEGIASGFVVKTEGKEHIELNDKC